MTRTDFLQQIGTTLAEIEASGLWKHERLITSPQSARISADGKALLTGC